MIEEICAEVKNYFIQPDTDVHASYFSIRNGTIEPLPYLHDGQYYRVIGSAMNDGVYCHGHDDLAMQDEDWWGTIWTMRVPKAFVKLCREIEAWEAKNSEALSGPYQSESFGGYSYSKGTSESGGAYTWKDQFRNKLNAYRKLTPM
jgi:hypothetical protein